MKLIILLLLITSLAVFTKCQRMQQDQFPFPPQFQTPSSGVMVSDSSIYLPPEPQTPIPYFTMNHMNKLPFQFLPPSGTKAPSVYPTPFSAMFSSSLRPRYEDDEDDEEPVREVRISSPRPLIKQNPNQVKNNITESNQEKRETRAIPKMFNFQQQQPQNRADKQPQSFMVSTQETPHSTSASRRMILTSEIQRNDINDHLKSHSNSPYSQLPNIFYSSTTEPAIPILRLSNEMDLDGSFSYEALGADQTHYVQHSRMENMGTDKEEQVVEGSYSYVGDNGQTYTVHYVADSNGYRASGDHLPSPPPIPEIIQRAIQYNLAEEAKRPPHTKLPWEETSPDSEYNSSDKVTRFPGPPTRSLFTGRTPEAFSFGFAQNHQSQNNVAVTNVPIPKTNFDIAVELSKSKQNVGPISPQITFSASHGSHSPSSSPQHSVSRSANNDKPSMPQIMNYEASAREIDQETKPLWRWQYGMNSNAPDQTPSKNSISRSFAEGDDVIINFNDMTPEQYTNMIRNQVLENNANEGREYQTNYFNNNFVQSTPSSLQTGNTYFNKNINNQNGQNNFNDQQKYFNALENKGDTNDFYTTRDELKTVSTTPQNTYTPTTLYSPETNKDDVNLRPKNVISNMYSNIIRQQNFIPPSQLVTRSYDYEDTSYEPVKISTDLNTKINQKDKNQEVNIVPSKKYWYTSDPTQETTIQPHYQIPSEANLSTPTLRDVNNDFRPILQAKDLIKQETTTTTEKNMEELIQENIFLKNIVNKRQEENIKNPFRKEESEINNSENKFESKPNNTESRDDKFNKQIHFHPKPQNEVKTFKKKPLDVADVLNYIAMKNHFEISKTKPKSFSTYQQNRDTPANYIPLEQETRDSVRNAEEANNGYRTFNQHQEEIQGMIKNYKVLQRQKNTAPNNNQYSDVPQKHVKTFHSPGLPPLGRAGPSMKSYLPPSYL